MLVTGAASGLGASVVTAARSAGWNAVGIDLVACPTIDHVVADVADAIQLRAAVEALSVRARGLDAVVTAAGVPRPRVHVDMGADEADAVATVDVHGSAATVRAALPFLLASGGTVVTIAMTGGAAGFTRSLAAELSGQVGVTLVVPEGTYAGHAQGHADQRRAGGGTPLHAASTVAAAVMHALSRPPGCEIRELVVTPSREHVAQSLTTPSARTDDHSRPSLTS